MHYAGQYVIVVYQSGFRSTPQRLWDATVHEPVCSHAKDHLALATDDEVEDALTEFDGGQLVRQRMSLQKARERMIECDWRACRWCNSGVQELAGRRDRHP